MYIIGQSRRLGRTSAGYGSTMAGPSKINGNDFKIEPLSARRIANALDGLGISYGTDPDGDLYAQWDGMRVWFLVAGTESNILRIMAGWTVRPPMRMLPALLPVINNWNATQRYPVAVVETLNDDLLQVLGDLNIDLTFGCTDQFLTRQIGLHVGTSIELFKHLANEFPEHTTWVNVENQAREQTT